MNKCKDCQYFESGSFEFNGKHWITAVCTLNHLVVIPDKRKCRFATFD